MSIRTGLSARSTRLKSKTWDDMLHSRLVGWSSWLGLGWALPSVAKPIACWVMRCCSLRISLSRAARQGTVTCSTSLRRRLTPTTLQDASQPLAVPKGSDMKLTTSMPVGVESVWL